ncbi:DUF4998 domain-containing protein [Pedobacter gandavensis]|uniref:DUF4998 domain-containing protein n=1 Tax=Pedobacter gandavensis TaxID=2679963 RepID=UPI002931713B|nr:DUF4998 domain-containing protein [Pedobacter gandavensis]
MMKRKYNMALFSTLIGCISLMACRKEDAYKKFMEGGELSYAGRVDSVIMRPGNQRIQLSLVLGSDPLVTKVRAYWNERRDSLELPVTRTQGKDTVHMVIPGLKEGNYNFHVFTYDKAHNTSVVVNASGTVYGESYFNSLVNRRLKEIGFSLDGSKLELNWATGNIDEIGIELKYTSADGLPKTVIVPPKQLKTELTDAKEGSVLKYRSLFKPEPNAIDTFSRDYANLTVPFFERKLDKTLFKELILPTDARTAHSWLMPYLWDEKYDPPGFATTNGKPVWFTFDTGLSTNLTRFKIWQANDRLYTGESVRKFEIWGSNNPNPDGSWESWTRLMSCESLKPSGLPKGQNSAVDIAYAKAGEEFVFPAETPKVRYLRLKLLENWGNGSFMTMAEVNLWTNSR